VILGGIIPEKDLEKMPDGAVRRVFNQKDYNLIRIMNEIIDIVADANGIHIS
jgi:methylmalonyl-CoA mutase cobalamin-binding subunit